MDSKINYSVVVLETMQELYRGYYLDCLHYLYQPKTFSELKSHAIIIIRSEDLDNIKNLKLG